MLTPIHFSGIVIIVYRRTIVVQEKKILFVSIAILAFLVILPVVMAGDDILFVELARPSLEQESAVTDAKLIEVNWKTLNEGHKKELTLNLFSGVEITAVRDRLDTPAPGSYVWVGHVPGAANSNVTLSVVDRTLMGSITLNGYEQFTIGSDGPGQILRQIDPSLQNEIEKEDTIFPPKLPSNAKDDTSYCEDGSRIDILVAYTELARRKLGGTAAITALINQRISEMNSANANSGLDFRYELVHAMETNYQESGNASIDLPRLKQTDDGALDDVTSARDTYNADLTSLIISEAHAGSGCGMAYVMNELSPNFSSYAFNVVALDYASNNLSCNSLTLAHELGHNMGNRHDRASSNSPPLLPYAFGYQSPRQTFRTIMAYNCTGGCPRINYWSNPDSSFSGESLGISHESTATQSADNARSMQETAYFVANFRENCPAAVAPTPTSTPIPGLLPTATPPASSSSFDHKSFTPIMFKN